MSTPDSIITAQTYSGCYGGEQVNVGDLLTVKVQCPSFPPSLIRKQIIFVIDESGSMETTMSSVRASLLAARNALLNLLGRIATNEAERDRIFNEECNVTMITFSNEPCCIWESILTYRLRDYYPVDLSFSQAVSLLESKSATNLGDAISLAFKKKIPDYATWIIVLTDGRPNRGVCQTPEAFTELMKSLPQQTKVIPLGYTTEFDPEILSILGTLTYVENEEAIAEILGSIMGEIATCYGMRGTIHLPSIGDNLSSDDFIIIPETLGIPRTVIGNSMMGCLYNERKFIYGYLPWGDTLRSQFSEYLGTTGNITYYDIARDHEVTIPFTIENGGSIPDEIREAYFESAKARIIMHIYNARKHRDMTREEIDKLKVRLEDWKHPLALPHKQEILRLLRTHFSDRRASMAALGFATGLQAQTSYTGRGPHSTATQRLMSIGATSDFHTSRQTVVIDPEAMARI